MYFYVRSRQTWTALAGIIAAGIMESQLADGAQQEALARLGSSDCPLDMSVSWTADVESPAYSTPVIIPRSAEGRKQVCEVLLQ